MPINAGFAHGEQDLVGQAGVQERVEHWRGATLRCLKVCWLRRCRACQNEQQEGQSSTVHASDSGGYLGQVQSGLSGYQYIMFRAGLVPVARRSDN